MTIRTAPIPLTVSGCVNSLVNGLWLCVCMYVCVGLLVIITALNSADWTPSGLNSRPSFFKKKTNVCYSGWPFNTNLYIFPQLGKYIPGLNFRTDFALISKQRRKKKSLYFHCGIPPRRWLHRIWEVTTFCVSYELEREKSQTKSTLYLTEDSQEGILDELKEMKVRPSLL